MATNKMLDLLQKVEDRVLRAEILGEFLRSGIVTTLDVVDFIEHLNSVSANLRWTLEQPQVPVRPFTEPTEPAVLPFVVPREVRPDPDRYIAVTAYAAPFVDDKSWR